MIDVQELRIGNWVYGIDTYTDKIGEFQVESIYQGEVNLMLYYDGSKEFATKVEPIPLTPEILEKCGFVACHPLKNFPQYTDYRFETVVINHNPDWGFCEFEFGPKDLEERAYLCKVKHLHQLQNLFWCLTGTELNYKP